MSTSLDSAANANQTSSLFREMYYPLSVDLDSLEFRERLGQLISRYLRVCKSPFLRYHSARSSLEYELPPYQLCTSVIHRPAKLTITGFRDQASRLSGVSDCEEWEQWLPTILRTETLLYAQAFFAVNHINFINPNAYKPERYVLKGHAIQKIKEKLKDADAAVSDGNIGAILCMASAAHLEVSSSELCPLIMETRISIMGIGYLTDTFTRPLDPLFFIY